jgi:hypothetical protein
MVTGGDCGVVLRHSLAYAPQLWRMCVVNRVPARVAAKQLNLDAEQARGAVRLLRVVDRVPSPERLALVVGRDWGLEDEDIAEIFGRSVRWARLVREQADEIKAEEPIPEELEFLDCGLQSDDVSPDELYKRVAELRAAGVIAGEMVGPRRVPAAMHAFSWWNQYAFVYLGTR